jgi:hypothetical protein
MTFERFSQPETSRRLEVVPRPERKNAVLEKLRGLVGEIAKQVNAQAEKESEVKGLLNSDGTISMEGFAVENGGIYTKEEVGSDLKDIFYSEISDSVSDSLTFGSPEQMTKIKEWRESREKSKSNQVEMAIMVLLHKMLKDEFLAVRSAKRDDNAGVDLLIVNKKTGAVICAIDDVHKEGDDVAKKIEKTTVKAQNGGATVRYGLISKNGKLKRTELKNLPVFYLGLNSEQFDELMAAMGSSAGLPPSSKEIEIFSQFVDDLESQHSNISGMILNSKDLRANLGQLGKPIKRLKQIAQATREPHLNQFAKAA